jgi:hypothetical protein
MFHLNLKQLVISETDIEAALNHLRNLPYSAALPEAWHRKRLLDQLREAIGKRPKLDQCYGVAPGVFAIIKPFGVDLASYYEPDERLQVWLLIRPCYTDLNRITIM